MIEPLPKHGTTEDVVESSVVVTDDVITCVCCLVLLQPTLEEMQNVLNKCVQVILKIAEHVPQWSHLIKQQKQQQKVR